MSASEDNDALAKQMEEMDVTDGISPYHDPAKEGALKLIVGDKLEDVYVWLQSTSCYTFKDQKEALDGKAPGHVFNIEDSDSRPVPAGKHKIGGAPTPHAFELVEAVGASAAGSGTYVFAAASDEEAKAWCDALNKAGETFKIDINKLPGNVRTALDMLKTKDVADEVDDMTLIRHLQACEWNADRTETLMKENAVWRKEYGLDSLGAAHVKDIIGSNFISHVGCDLKGRPTIVLRPRNLPTGLTVLQATLALTYMFERLVERTTAEQPEYAVVVDMTGLNRGAVDTRLPRIITQLVQLRYPGRVGQVVLYNQPWFFNLVWSVVSRWLDPYMAAKVRFAGTGLDKLQQYYAPDQMLKELGGTFPDTNDEWIAARIAKEGDRKHELDPTVTAADYEGNAGGIDSPDHTGWMTKQGGMIKNTKKRWFVLKGRVLFYFADMESPPSGKVILDRTIVEHDEGKPQIDLVTPLRTYKFEAPDLAQKDEWVAKLNAALPGKKKKKLKTLG